MDLGDARVDSCLIVHCVQATHGQMIHHSGIADGRLKVILNGLLQSVLIDITISLPAYLNQILSYRTYVNAKLVEITNGIQIRRVSEMWRP